MRILPRAHPDELAGDHLLRKARRCVLLAVISLLVSTALYIWLGAVWNDIRPLGGMLFVLAAASVGLGLVVVPAIALVFGVLALFLRVESCYVLRTKALSKADRIAVGLAATLSFLPALLACIPVIVALLTGQDVWPDNALHRWQGVVIWLASALILAALAMLYWRSRRRKPKSPQT